MSSLDKCLNQLSTIFSALRLSVDPSKSKLVWFCPRRRALDFTPTPVCWNGVTLPPVDSVVCLGVILDPCLSYNAHLSTLRGKLNSVVYGLHRLRRLGFPRSCLVMVYNILLMSSLTYGIAVWGKAPDTLLKTLRVVQNNALRAVLGLRTRSSVSLAYSRFRILEVRLAYKYQVAQLSFLSFHGCVSFLIA